MFNFELHQYRRQRACEVEEGITQECGFAVAGNNRVFLLNRKQVKIIYDPVTHAVKDMVMKETAPSSGIFFVAYEIEANENSIAVNSVFNDGDINNFTHSTSFAVSELSQAVSNFIESALLAKLIVLVETKGEASDPNFTGENKWLVYGAPNGMGGKGGGASENGSTLDTAGSTLTIAGVQPRNYRELRLTYGATLIPPTLTTAGAYPTQEDFLARLINPSDN